jgi:hypothetical protein
VVHRAGWGPLSGMSPTGKDRPQAVETIYLNKLAASAAHIPVATSAASAKAYTGQIEELKGNQRESSGYEGGNPDSFGRDGKP